MHLPNSVKRCAAPSGPLHSERSSTLTTLPPITSAIPGTGFLFFLYLILFIDTYVGVSREFRVLLTARIPSLIAWTVFLGVLAKTGARAFGEFRLSALLTGFVAFTACTLLYAYLTANAFAAFRAQLDNLGLFVTTAYLLDRVSRLRAFAVTVAGVIAVVVLRNFDALSSSVRRTGFRAGYFMGDGNDFAWALVTFLPFAAFLALHREPRLIRLLGAGATLLAVVGIVGTQSRGATLAVVVAGTFFLLGVARRRLVATVCVAGVVAIGLSLAPSGYFERMESVTSYQEDGSAMGRLQAWRLSMRMALDHPLGVGADNFNTAYGRVYLPKLDTNVLAWGAGRWLSPHSIYARALGEYGVLGFLLILTVLYTNIVDNLRVRRRAAALPESSGLPAAVPGIVVMSVLGYAVGGIFLGGLTYPHLFIVSGVTASLRRRMSFLENAASESPSRTLESNRRPRETIGMINIPPPRNRRVANE